MANADTTKNVIIFHNDLTDSDNWAVARVLMKKATKPGTQIIWIVEPRQVAFGLSMTQEQKRECETLLETYFSELGPSFKVLLNGSLKKSDLDNVAKREKLNEPQLRLLNSATKPQYGPRNDAEVHNRLVAHDLLRCLASWTTEKVTVSVDFDALDRVDEPANLNIHHHEELTARSSSELDKYEAILKEAQPQEMSTQLQEWYNDCICTLSEELNPRGHFVQDLDFEQLCREIRSANSVRFFGGASMRLLQRLLDRGLAKYMSCYMQTGTYDILMNLFPNQFNIVLDVEAAKNVLSRASEFGRFVIAPTSTTRAFEYSLKGLSWMGGGDLEKRFLGYNCRVDPKKIAAGVVTLDDYADKLYTMPDLTAFLCAFWPDYTNIRMVMANIDEKKDGLELKNDEGGNLSVCTVDGRRVLDTPTLQRFLFCEELDLETS